MAVTVLLGKGKSGKTAACFEQIQASAARGEKVLYIVPDQASYSAERRLAEAMPGKGFVGIQVAGFSRLAYQVLQARGKTHESLSEVARNIILQRLLHQYEHEFLLLQTASRQANFAAAAGRFIMECRSFCIDPQVLREAARALGDTTLSRKIKDMALLYEGYLSFLDGHCGSADDVMTVLARELPSYDFARGAHIWVDGFHWFTPQQLQVLRVCERIAAQVTITLTIDGQNLASQARETALFHRAYEIYEELRSLFPHMETACVRTSEEMPFYALYEDFFHPVPRARKTPVSGLTLTECGNRDLEMDAVARQICRLVRDGYRYRDILVLTRSSEVYQQCMERTFTAYGIPFFSDSRRPMTSHPLAEAILALLDVFQTRWAYEPLFQLLKTDLFPISRHDADLLENYCLAFGIQGKHWFMEQDWTYSKKRFLEENTADAEKETAYLAEINRIRQTVWEVLKPFWEEAQKEHTVTAWCTLLYQWLTVMEVPQKLRQWQQADEAAGYPAEAKEHGQVWKRILDFLGEAVRLCGDDALMLREWRQLAADGLESLQFSLIPPTLDHVTYTAVERGYTMEGKVVFVCGLNDGVFPQHSGEEGMLNDAERHCLGKLGIKLGPGRRFRSFQEKFLFYVSLTRAAEKIFLSYALSDGDGNALEPSLWVRQLQDRGYVSALQRETGVIEDGCEENYIVAAPKAISYLPVMFRPAAEGLPVRDVWWALYDWACANGWSYEAMQAVQGIFYTNVPQILPDRIVQALFAPEGILQGSVTKFEQYRACPFAYFARYGLKLEERQVYQFAAPDLGMLVHGALRLMGEMLLAEGKQWQDIPEEKIVPLCRDATERLAPYVQQDILMSNAYFAQIKERLIAVLARTVRRLCAFSAVSNFHMERLEKSFGRDGSDWRSLRFVLPDGLQVLVNGQIDRIDSLRIDGTTYIVVIDYKSGKKRLELGQIMAGMELQLLTYMQAALLHMGEHAKPAAVLYCHVRNDKKNLPHVVSDKDKELLYNNDNKMDGFYLDNSQIMTSLDTSMHGYSSFLNISLKKDGTLSSRSGNVYKEEEWKQLMELASDHIKDIAANLGDGKIFVRPVRLGQNSPCRYCPYHSVCCFDVRTGKDTYDVIRKEKKEDMMKRLCGQHKEDDIHGVDKGTGSGD